MPQKKIEIPWYKGFAPNSPQIPSKLGRNFPTSGGVISKKKEKKRISISLNY